MIQIAFNTIESLTGAIYIAQNQGTAAISGSAVIHRNVIFKNSLANQEVIAVTSNYSTDFNIANNNNERTINFNVDQYLIVVATLELASETMGMRSIRGKIIR